MEEMSCVLVGLSSETPNLICLVSPIGQLGFLTSFSFVTQASSPVFKPHPFWRQARPQLTANPYILCSSQAPSPPPPSANEPKYEKRWLDAASLPLSMARVSRYKAGADKLR